MKAEYVERKQEGEVAPHVMGIKLITESDLEKGILKEFDSGGIKINSREMGFGWMELTFRSLIKPREYPNRDNYEAFTVHVHKGWLPMLAAFQEARTFGTRKPTIEHILDELILCKLQDGRDALSDILLEVNAPKKEEE